MEAGVDRHQQREGREDADGADRERQQRRRATEDQEREQRKQRKGERLGEPQVTRGLVADLGAGDRRAAQDDLRVVGEPRLQAFIEDLFFGPGSRRRGEQSRAAVRRRCCRRDPRDPGVGGEQRGRPAHRGAARPFAHERENAGCGRGAGRVFDRRARRGGLGAGVDKVVARGEHAARARADREGDYEEDADGGRETAGVADGQAGD